MSLIRRETRAKDGNVYEYSLYVTESARVASFHLPLYSIEIKLTLKNGTSWEYLARDVFSNTSRAISFFEMLVQTLATPMSLPYIIDESLYV